MWVLCLLLLAARANSLPQESEQTTFPSPVDEGVAIDNDVLEALEHELIRNNITLTRDAEIPNDIAQVADYYDRVLNTLTRPGAELPSLRQGSTQTGSTDTGSLKKKAAIAAFGAGSIVSLAKLALAIIAFNSGLRQASVSFLNGGVSGVLTLRQAAAPFGPTVITGTLTGLTEGSHGFHIHEFGNMDGGCDSTGGHYNPFNVAHGGSINSTRHVGDLGNVETYANGTTFVSVTSSQVMLVGPTSVIGRAMVLHSLKDDLGLGGNTLSLTTGNSGTRVSCGVIGRA